MKPIDPQLWHRRGEDPQAIKSACQGPDGRAWLMRWLPTRAYENGVYYVYTNPVGVDHDTIKPGLAMIIGAYVAGTNPRADQGLQAMPELIEFVKQPALEPSQSAAAWAQLSAIANRMGLA